MNIKLSDTDKLMAEAMVDWYGIDKTTNERLTVTEKPETIRIMKKNKFTLTLYKYAEGYRFSYDGQPKAVAQTLFNLISKGL